MVGVVPPNVSVEVEGVPALKVQFAAGLAALFPKIKALMLWLPSRVTVEVAVMVKLLKSAVSPMAVGSVPPDQFAWVSQLPLALPLVKWVQVKVDWRRPRTMSVLEVTPEPEAVIVAEPTLRIGRAALALVSSLGKRNTGIANDAWSV